MRSFICSSLLFLAAVVSSTPIGPQHLPASLQARDEGRFWDADRLHHNVVNSGNSTVLTSSQLADWTAAHPGVAEAVYLSDLREWVFIRPAAAAAEVGSHSRRDCPPLSFVKSVKINSSKQFWGPYQPVTPILDSTQGDGGAITKEFSYSFGVTVSAGFSLESAFEELSHAVSASLSVDIEQSWETSTSYQCNANPGDKVQVWSRKMLLFTEFDVTYSHNCGEGDTTTKGIWTVAPTSGSDSGNFGVSCQINANTDERFGGNDN